MHRVGGSARVRDVQRRLWSLGFRPGPVDGLFGPQTKAAVEWFQIKHALRPTGTVGLETLTVLRERTGAAAGTIGAGRAEPTAAAPAPRAVPQPPRAGARRGGAPRRVPPTLAHDGHDIWAIAAALLLLAAGLLMTRVSRPTTSRVRRPKPAPAPAKTVSQVPSASRPVAVAYFRGNGEQLAEARSAIARECARRGWRLGRLLRDDERTAGRVPLKERPGLTTTLEHIGRPGRSQLVVSRLGHLSRSAGELRVLFDWFARHEVGVVVLDVGIDTTTRDGRRRAQSMLASIARRQAHARANGARGRNVATLAVAGGNGNGNGNGGRHAAARGDPR